MEVTPLVSVIIPTYNRASVVGNAIRSVLAQSVPCEIIVVDDGSTDFTANVVKGYSHLGVKYIHQPNGGKSKALNTGLSHATGNYIAFLDDDDEWLPTKIERQLAALAKYDNICEVCFTDIITTGDPRIKGTAFERRGKQFDKPFFHIDDPVSYVLRPPHTIYIQSVLANRITLFSGPGALRFNERLTMAEDTDMIFHMANRTHFAGVNEPLVKIDRTPKKADSLTVLYEANPSIELHCKQLMYEDWLSMNLSPEHRRIIMQRMADNDSAIADWFLQVGQTDEAVKALWVSVAHSFSFSRLLKLLAVKVAPNHASRIAFNRAVARKRREQQLFLGT